MTLDDLPPGAEARITSVEWQALASDEGKRRQALGIDSGAAITVAHRGLLLGRDPLAIRIGSMTVALRRSHARAIRVESA
jgi:ferrous iron transport protein A